MNLQQPELQQLGLLQGHDVDVLRLDLIHPDISGNKWFKLKYNLAAALNSGNKTLLTFGGAHSNHIAATAAAASQAGLNAIAVIRGEEPEKPGHTLLFAKSMGMQLYFVSRSDYSRKNSPEFIKHLQEKFGNFFLIPEGGNNKEGIQGCTEILVGMENYDYILCACGTGATFTGLYLGKKKDQVLVGISVLKGENLLPETVNHNLCEQSGKSAEKIAGNGEAGNLYLKNSCILNQYAFSGYATYNRELIKFKTEMERVYGIPLDYIYTCKVFYALYDLLGKEKFRKGSRILVIHSGGLQGNRAFEERYHLKEMR